MREPPETGPADGDIPVTAAPATYSNVTAIEDVAVTSFSWSVTFTTPTLCEGVMQSISVLDTYNPGDELVPNIHTNSLSDENPDPITATIAPP